MHHSMEISTKRLFSTECIFVSVKDLPDIVMFYIVCLCLQYVWKNKHHVIL